MDVDGYCSEEISLLCLLMLCEATPTHLYRSSEYGRVKSGVLPQASGSAHLILRLFERPSDTRPGNTQNIAWIQNAGSLRCPQMEAVELKQKCSKALHRSRLCLLFEEASPIHNYGWSDRSPSTIIAQATHLTCKEVLGKVVIYIAKETECFLPHNCKSGLFTRNEEDIHSKVEVDFSEESTC